MTLAGLLKEGRERLKAEGIAEWELDAWYLLEYAAGCTRSGYLCTRSRRSCRTGNRFTGT